MARDLRVRSPVKTRHSQGAMSDRKRKLDDTDLTLRRSTRALLASDQSQLSQQKIRAYWKKPYLIITGLSNLPLDDEQADGTNPDDVGSSDDDSEDGATWEKRWLESPSKRRKIERLSDSPAGSPREHSKGHSRSGSGAKLTSGSIRLRRQIHKPNKTSKIHLTNVAHPSTPPASTGASRDTSAPPSPQRQIISEAVSETFSQSRNGNLPADETQENEEYFSDKSSAGFSLSSAPSSVGTPEPVEVENTIESAPAAPKDPNNLEETDLPPPFLDFLAPGHPDVYEDEAARIMARLFAPIPLPIRFIRPLVSHAAESRSTETLITLAANTQKALQAWQDEYIRLDKKTAPVSLPFPKKPATGGRIPLDPAVFDMEKHKELYGDGSTLAKAMGIVQPSSSSRSKGASNTPVEAASGIAGGRELRRRRGDNGIIDGLGISSDDAGAKTSKRARRPVRRFDIGQNNASAEPVSGKGTDFTEPSPQPVRRRRRGAQKVADADKSYLAGPRQRRVQQLARHDDPDSLSPTPDRIDAQEAQMNASNATRHFTHPTGPAAATSSSTVGHPSPFNPQHSTMKGEPLNESGSRGGTTGGRNNTSARGKVGVGEGKSSQAKEIPRPLSPASAAVAAEKKARAKSEKRSESMTAWWAARKKKAAEERIKEMHDRGEFREGTWNVDTIKAWGAAANRQSATAAATPGTAAASSTGYPNQVVPNGGFVGYMPPNNAPGLWAPPPWPAAQGINLTGGQNAIAYPYPGSGYQMQPGTQWDGRGYVQHQHQHQHPPPPPPPPSAPSHSIHQRLPQPPTHNPTPARQSFSSISQLVTPNHPFAQPPNPPQSQNSAPYHGHALGLNRPPSRHETPFQKGLAQNSPEQTPLSQRRPSYPHQSNTYQSTSQPQHLQGRQDLYPPPPPPHHNYQLPQPQPAHVQHTISAAGSSQPPALAPPRPLQPTLPPPHGQRELPPPTPVPVAPKPASSVTKHRPFEL